MAGPKPRSERLCLAEMVWLYEMSCQMTSSKATKIWAAVGYLRPLCLRASQSRQSQLTLHTAGHFIVLVCVLPLSNRSCLLYFFKNYLACPGCLFRLTQVLQIINSTRLCPGSFLHAMTHILRYHPPPRTAVLWYHKMSLSVFLPSQNPIRSIYRWLSL